MRYGEILLERLSGILYHSTSIKSVLEILVGDKFRLTPDFGTGREGKLRSGDKIYYMSFSRSRVNDYRSYMGGSSLLVIDGDKLNQRYSGRAVDYWGVEFDKAELEDRLFSDKPYIGGASSYIREIHCLPRLSNESDKFRDLGWLRKIYILAKRENIPVYVYVDADNYRLLNKSKSVKISDFGFGVDDYKPYISYGGRNPYAGYLELLSDSVENLSDRARDLLYKIRYDNFGDVARGLAADIHNDRFGRGRHNLDKFLFRLRELKIKSVGELLDYIRDRYDLW